MSLIPKHVSFCLENIASEPSEEAQEAHVIALIQTLALRIVGKRPTQDRERVTVTVSFSDKTVAKMDSLYGKEYTTAIYKRAFQRSKPLAAHLFSLFSGQQHKLFRTSFDRCKAVYGIDSDAVVALASFPTGDQQLRWASAPSAPSCGASAQGSFCPRRQEGSSWPEEPLVP